MTIQWQLSEGTEDKSESIVAVIDGDWFVAEKDHPNYDEIKAELIYRLRLSAGEHFVTIKPLVTDENIRDLFDLSFKIGQKFDAVSPRLRVSGGRLFYDGDEINGSIVDAILRFHNQQVDDWKPLVRFLDKIKINPSQDSQERLYDWLAVSEFTITDDGDIIAYKSLNNDFTSIHAGPAIVDGVYMDGNIPNNPGSRVEIPRNTVTWDPDSACSFGLHAATYRFAKGFSRGPIVKLKINPTDVVSVPAHDNEKMRVCGYDVIEQVREALAAVVDPHSYYASMDAVYDDELDFMDDETEDEVDEDTDVSHKFGEQRDHPGMSGIPVSESSETLVDRIKRRFGM